MLLPGFNSSACEVQKASVTIMEARSFMLLQESSGMMRSTWLACR